MTTLDINTKLQGGKYVIREILGHGSFGITYRATTELSLSGDLGRLATEVNVAVKEFYMSDVNHRPEGSSAVDGTENPLAHDYRIRFRKEAEHLATLNHRGIVHVADVFDENNTTYYVMEYVDGENLDAYIACKGRLDEKEAWEILKQVGEALDHMHKCRMLHLDVKPKNIMRRKDGSMVLIDFGLSKVFDASGAPMTGTTVGLGTPGYAPIEQNSLRRGSPFPATMDVYALGATLYKMLTGKTPPQASWLLENGFPVDQLREVGVSEATIAVLCKSMESQWTQRYHTVAEMIGEAPLSNSSTVPFNAPMQQGGVGTPVANSGDATVPIRDNRPMARYANVPDSGATVARRADGTSPFAVNHPREVGRPDKAVEISLVNRLQGALTYRFVLSVDDESSVVVSRDGRVLLNDSWRGGIDESIWQQFVAEGFFSPIHWENETDKPEPNPVEVSCVFHYKDGHTFVRAVPYAGGAVEGLLQHAVENVVNNTMLRNYLDEAIRRGKEEKTTVMPTASNQEPSNSNAMPRMGGAHLSDPNNTRNIASEAVSSGNDVALYAAEQRYEAPAGNTTQTKKGTLWLIPVIALAVIMTGVAVWFYLSRSGIGTSTDMSTDTTRVEQPREREVYEDYQVDVSSLKKVSSSKMTEEDGVTAFTYTGTVDQTGRPHGKGEAYYGRNDNSGRKKYNGEFRNGKCHGKGCMEYENGNSFMGTFANGHLKSGRLYVAVSNQAFVGSFENDSPYNGYWVDDENNHLSQVAKGKEKQL